MSITKNILLGVAVADALGVPVEFQSRAYLKENPVTDMMGYGTYNQPPGTWSDDSSLTFCLAESLLNGYDLADIARKFTQWYYEARWTPHGEVFDIGITTRNAIFELDSILKKRQYHLLTALYSDDEMQNGNGALMRILPLLLYIKGKSMNDKFQIIREVSALTHGHIRSAIACLIYLEIAEKLADGFDKKTAYFDTQSKIYDYLKFIEIAPKERSVFFRILDMNIANFEEDDIQSSGYVMHSLEAALWCLMRYDNYKDTVLKAVNLGHDTDTTAAIVGGLAGILYGSETIPRKWVKKLACLDDILILAKRLNKLYW